MPSSALVSKSDHVVVKMNGIDVDCWIYHRLTPTPVAAIEHVKMSGDPFPDRPLVEPTLNPAKHWKSFLLIPPLNFGIQRLDALA